MVDKVRWGVLSTARIARQSTIPAIINSSNAEIIAIASSNPLVTELANQYDISKIYNRYDELLDDPEIDAVYIPLPNHLHKEWVIKAAEKGKHILCEKPVALNIADVNEMVQYCKDQNVIFMEAFMYQFHPQHRRVGEIISSGEIGKPKMMRSNLSFLLENAKDFRLDMEQGGGAMYDLGCYCIHSVRNFLNTEPARVFVHSPETNFDVDLTAIAIFELKNGMMANFDISFEMVRRERYEIVGTTGSIEVPRAFSLPEHFKGDGIIRIEKENEIGRTETINGNIFKAEIEHFSQCLIKGQQPVYAGENMIQNIRVVEACYESIRTGKWINVN